MKRVFWRSLLVLVIGGASARVLPSPSSHPAGAVSTAVDPVLAPGAGATGRGDAFEAAALLSERTSRFAQVLTFADPETAIAPFGSSQSAKSDALPEYDAGARSLAAQSAPPVAAPEPSNLVLALSALTALGYLYRRRIAG